MNQLIKTDTAIAAQDIKQSLIASFVEGREERTAKTYLNNLRQFMLWLQAEGITRPTRSDLLRYKKALTEEHKPATVKQYLQSVKQFFAWAAAEGLYPDIAAHITTPKIRNTHKKDFLNAQEVETIETSIKTRAEERTAAAAEALKDMGGRIQRSTEQGKRLYAMYLLAVNAGLRTVEISRADIKDLETKNGQACLYIWGKGHSEPDQRKPLAPAVYDALRDYINSRTDNPTGTSPLFVSTGNRSGGQRIASTTISTMLKRAMQAAGFDSERLTAHSLRHTTGQNVMQITGSNLYKTQQYMRHENPATTEIYLDNESSAQDAIIAQRLYEHYHGGTTSGGAADKLQQAMQTMTPAQLEQLAQIAAAMTAR